LNGNSEYFPFRAKSGGSIKRLKNACLNDYKVKNILVSIEELDL